ncbi:LacI family DNA-binding transcriptional regulator [Pseudonocardia sp. TRM90224]|uniref:LacI family DNA-binding transcriptional regulator n=1 Tax=Pseudonocardia sp. TRM90224 TaxID=2812678 RepID=UPI001E32C829|nr:LacI family DNA-binding transcriptional regulator [Pseudonocardia sp. TRM90224]
MADPRPVVRSAPTLESVASVAGVSRATAGRVLSGASNVTERTREAVLRAADELGYVTNRAARALMTQRSGLIAFVVAEPEERFFNDPHFSLALRGAHAAVAKLDVQLVFSIVHLDADRRKFERFARAGHLDGAILASLHGDHPLPRALQAAGIPVILMGRPLVPVAGVSYVSSDNVGGGRLAAARLADGGRTRLATITGPRDMTAALDRESGFLGELAVRGRSGLVVEGDFSMESGRAAMTELLATRPDIDGVFAASDLMALGAFQAITDAGRSIPEDVAVVGFDDSPLAATVRPGLTTIRQPVVDMGATLAQRLLRTIEDGTVLDPVLIPAELVARESA